MLMQSSQQPKKIPIERALDKYTDMIEDLIPNMPKDIKHTWGQKLLDLDLMLYELLYTAKEFSCERQRALRKFKNKFFLMQTILRKAHNKRFVADKPYIKTFEPASSIERQLTGWIKALPASESATADGEC